jgi:6-phosphofructokinase 1
MRKIAILTRDCAGINAAIRSAVRTAVNEKIEVLGVVKGYDGLIDGNFITLNRSSVSGIINRGGTILKTARSQRFYQKSYQQKAVKNLEKHDIEGLLVIGGNGSFRAAHILSSISPVHIVGIPATIDNDISGIDLTIGADTSVNVALDALDKIRDTATSLERIFVIEVMGRESGYLALQVALAGGCENVLVPEKKSNIETICKEIKKGELKGKSSWIIIVAEGKAKAQDIAEVVTKKTGLETRITVLGHIQRGGHPTAVDRILAARLGYYSIKVLQNGSTDVCVGIKNNKFYTIPMKTAIEPKKIDVEEYYKLIKILT